MNYLETKQFLLNPILTTYYSAPWTPEEQMQAEAMAEMARKTIAAKSAEITEQSALHYKAPFQTRLPLEFIATPGNIEFLPPKVSGKGRFKTMKRGILVNRSDASIRRVAVLIISQPSDFDKRERTLLTKFKGKNIVPELIDYCEFTEEGWNAARQKVIKTIPVFIEEECTGGDLSDAKTKISQEQISFFAYQILKIVKIFHTSGYVLRDIKPANILLKENDEIVMGDIGTAWNYATTEEPEFPQKAGTPVFLSPESAFALESSDQKRTSNKPPRDVWSVGTTIADLLNHKELIRYYVSPLARDIPSLLEHISHLTAPPTLPPTEPPIAQFAAHLLNPNPEQRPTAREGLLHPLLRKSLLASGPFLSALANCRLSIETVYKDLLGQNFEGLLSQYKKSVLGLCAATMEEIDKRDQTPIVGSPSTSAPSTQFPSIRPGLPTQPPEEDSPLSPFSLTSPIEGSPRLTSELSVGRVRRQKTAISSEDRETPLSGAIPETPSPAEENATPVAMEKPAKPIMPIPRPPAKK